MRTRVKICGITRIEDALAAATAGADAIGLVFYRQSPRAVDLDTAAAICAILPPFVSAVGLFVDAHGAEVDEVLEAVPLAALQFHGDEPGDFCNAFGIPYIKALRMRPDFDVAAAIGEYPDAAGILLDTYDAELAGGTGKVFDWNVVPRDLGKPTILAGGLNAENITQAIRAVRPYAVDVSGGVELSKGIKDPNKMRAFINAVNSESNT